MSVVTLGCGRNEVDSDQVTGALEGAGFVVAEDPGDADCILVNTCTFIEPARAESVEVILAACDAQSAKAVADGTLPVVVMGCMAEQHGAELASSLPEVAAVVGFADYPRLPEVVADAIGSGPGTVSPRAPSSAAPVQPGRLLPLAGRTPAPLVAPPTAQFPVRTAPRGVWAYMKLAGGCDRACTFCTIPSYRGGFASRPVSELVAETRWLVQRGVREIVGVSENTTSWGKDRPGGRGRQVQLLRALEGVDGLERIRLLYLQPDELRPELLDVMAGSDVVASYFDLSLQHASPTVLTRMARAGGAERFLSLIEGIRARDPGAVFRSSFILGFPGETDDDVELLAQFLADAQLDWVGLFTYSREEATPSARMPGQVSPAEARARRDHVLGVAEWVAQERAQAFIGRELSVLIEEREGPDAVGRSYREAPETDGEIRLTGCSAPVGASVRVSIAETHGVDLMAAEPDGRLA
ncbi:MAG: 30S ribosomal protein S12 methylthiotransferase RimO [Egibacteraceae bacterium]